MNAIEWLQFASALLVGTLLALAGEWISGLSRPPKWLRRPTTSRAEPEPPTIENRLSDLSQLMRSSALLLEEVQAEIQARIALAEKAKKDADDNERLAQLNEAQKIALARLIRAEVSGEVSRGSRRSFWQGFALNLLFFVLGGVVSVATTVWLGP